MIELSVIIATHNRSARLSACLNELAQQTYPASDFEVIVIDDGSTDHTAEMVTQLRMPFALRVIRQEKSGQPAALNRGAAEARGRYLLFLDDDIVPAPMLVGAHWQALYRYGRVAVIGRLTLRPPAYPDWFARQFTSSWNEHYARLSQSDPPATWRDCYSGNLSVPHEVFLQVGGFATDLRATYDLELGYRLHSYGVPIVYIPTAQGEHADYKRYGRLLNDAEREGGMLSQLLERHPELVSELLSEFWNTTPRVTRLRRLLLALDVSPWLLAEMGRVTGDGAWQREWFRFLQTYAYWYGVKHASPGRDTWQRMIYRTPILMYHAFGAPGEKPSRYVVPVRRFARQLEWLKRGHYHVLSLEQFVSYRREHRLPPARSVVITIDDGYADTWTLAYPLLYRYSLPATLFMVSGKVGGVMDWDRDSELAGRPLLSWPQLLALSRAGIQIGAHTQTHAPLSSLPGEDISREVNGSRFDLERGLKVPVRVFSYPYGKYNATAQAVVEQAGFLGSCGVKEGLNDAAAPLYGLRRVEIRGTDSLLEFAFKVWVGRGLASFRQSAEAK